MRILCLSSYPNEAAATRFRIEQFVEPLRERGIDLTVRPFLNSEQFKGMYVGGNRFAKATGLVGSVAKRLADVLAAKKYDALLIQREAMFFGPEIFEWLINRTRGLPILLDLDDATYVSYKSPTYGSLGSFLKFFGKTDRLITRASTVICGNRFIAEYVKAKGTDARIVPTIADTDIYKPLDTNNEVPVIGWIGTHSTFPSVESVFPVLERLAKKHRFRLKLVGTGSSKVSIPSVEVDIKPWALEREVEDFRSLDIGLYPIATSESANEEWIKGKSGFKAIQYMAVGKPFIMSPVGVCAEIGQNGKTHFNATTPEDWYNCLDALLANRALRKEIGEAGRQHSLENYTIERWSAELADIFFSVRDEKRGKRIS